jgi:GNAT superfamily N-acetyltransferase
MPSTTLLRAPANRTTDVPVILKLIRELADYEHESASVLATPEKLLSTLAFAPSGLISPDNTTPSTGDAISSSRPARCLLVSPSADAQPVGLALYFYNYSTWRAAPGIFLEDLFVRESERGKGYGQKLLGTLAKEVVEMGGGRLEWSVLKVCLLRFALCLWRGARWEDSEG